MKKWMCWILTIALALALGAPAFAGAAETAVQSDILTHLTMLDALALGMIPADYVEDGGALTDALYERMKNAYYTCMDASEVTYEAVAEAPESLNAGDFAESLYAMLAKTSLPDAAAPSGDAAAFLQAAGILTTDGADAPDAAMAAGDAAMMFVRAAVYAVDASGNSSKGLLWRIADTDTVVYLLGSIHIDDALIYPFDEVLMHALLDSDALILEVDFGDEDGIAYLQSNMAYPTGDTLSDHISPELMAQVLAIYEPLGADQSIVDAFRPWVLASEIVNLSIYTQDGGTIDASNMPLVMDSYVYSKAIEAGIPVRQVEGYAYQADLFNGLADDVQEEYLQSAVDLYNGELPEDEDMLATYDVMMRAWRDGDPDAFVAAYDKDAQEDALSLALFVDRDVHMTEYVVDLLNDSPGQYLLTVGSGHMVGATGIVASLIEQGYDVAFVQ